MTIRDLEPGDLTSIRDLLSSTPEATQWSFDDLLLAGQRNIRIRVAEKDAGICGLVIFRTIADEAEILNLAVHPAERRQATGSALVQDAVTTSKLAGAQRIFLEVRDSNKGAREFYSRLGFQPVGRRRRYYRDPVEDAFVLGRSIE